CVGQNPDQIVQVSRLVTVKKIVLQVERLKDKVGVLLVETVLAEERVVARRDIRPGGVEDAELVHPACRLDSRQKVGKEFLVTFAIEDQHGNTVLVSWRPNYTKQVLGNDVFEQRGLARTSGSEDNRLHD